MIKIIAVIALIVAVIIIGPILTIWSLNTLFPALAIPYVIETWAAVVILAATIRSNVSLKGK
jgi:urea transporter